MSDIIGIILILTFLVMAYFFASVIAGRKKGDEQIFQKQLKEIEELKEKNNKLQSRIDHLLDHKVELILKKLNKDRVG